MKLLCTETSLAMDNHVVRMATHVKPKVYRVCDPLSHWQADNANERMDM